MACICSPHPNLRAFSHSLLLPAGQTPTPSCLTALTPVSQPACPPPPPPPPPLFQSAEGIEIKISDELVSQPYVDMTVKLMERFGVKVGGQAKRGWVALHKKGGWGVAVGGGRLAGRQASSHMWPRPPRSCDPLPNCLSG